MTFGFPVYSNINQLKGCSVKVYFIPRLLLGQKSRFQLIFKFASGVSLLTNCTPPHTHIYVHNNFSLFWVLLIHLIFTQHLLNLYSFQSPRKPPFRGHTANRKGANYVRKLPSSEQTGSRKGVSETAKNTEVKKPRIRGNCLQFSIRQLGRSQWYHDWGTGEVRN